MGYILIMLPPDPISENIKQAIFKAAPFSNPVIVVSCDGVKADMEQGIIKGLDTLAVFRALENPAHLSPAALLALQRKVLSSAKAVSNTASPQKPLKQHLPLTMEASSLPKSVPIIHSPPGRAFHRS